MRNIFVLAALSLSLFISNSAFAKECKTGKACGNACIAKDKVCAADAHTATSTVTTTETHAEHPATPDAPATATTATNTTTTHTAPAPAKVCKTGKACGNACIAKDAVCTK